MNIKEITTKYKDGDSVDKLGIISNIVTIITAIIALVTGQLLTLRFVFSERTFTLIAIYILAMAISLLVFYFCLKYSTIAFKIYNSFIVKIALSLIALSALIFTYIIIWSFVLQLN